MDSSENVLDVELIDTYKKSAQKAHDGASKKCTQLNFALGQEGIADVIAWTQSGIHVAKAVVTQSYDPLVEGAPYLESAASTIPIIGPLVAERFEAGREVKRIARFQDVLEKHPEAAIDDPELMEVDLLTLSNGHGSGEHDVDISKGFWRGLMSDWGSSVKNTVPIAGSALNACFQMVTMPIHALTEIEISKDDHFQMLRLMNTTEAFQASVHLNINEEDGTFTVDQDALEREYEFHQDERGKTKVYLILSGVGTLSAANFIRNETEEAVHIVSDYFSQEKLPEHEADPITSLTMIGGMMASVLSHIIPASLTLSPLKNTSRAFSEHFSHMSKVTRRLNIMDFARDHAQQEASTEPEAPAAT